MVTAGDQQRTTADRAGRAAQVRATRELILTAAERMFAEHGVYAVSNRHVSEAAGQGNNAAVGYHFGTKADLIRAIIRRHAEPIEELRIRMVREVGDSPGVREWVACLIRPSTQHLADLQGTTWYARFSAQVMTDPALRQIMIDEALDSPALHQILAELNRCLPELPPDVRRERNDMARHLMVHMPAERERALASDHPTPRRSWHDTGSGLIDAITAIWLAPYEPSRSKPSEPTRTKESLDQHHRTGHLPDATRRNLPFDPPPVLKDLQTEGRRSNAPLARVRLWDDSTPWLVTTYEAQRDLLADPRVSADMGATGYPRTAAAQGDARLSFIGLDDPEHVRLRRMVTALHDQKVEAMRPGVQKIVDDLIDELLAGPKPVDLVQAFALPVPSLVICRLLGVPYTDHDFFQQNSNILIHRESTPEQRATAGGKLGEYLGRLIGEKIKTPTDDLLSQLAGRVTAGELEHSDAVQMGILLLIAGHETTANMIALGTLALLEHPEQLAALRDASDPQVVAGAVEELLRYLNITQNGRRRVATEDIPYGDQLIRAGEGMIMANDIANRDPGAFPDPDRLDIARDARHHVAFGFGGHQCLGQPLARMELQVAYATLLRRIPTLRRAAELDQIQFRHDGAVYGVYELPVTW